MEKGKARARNIRMSAVFRKAAAAAAMTKLMEGAHNEDCAAHYVVTQLGDLVFSAERTCDSVKELKEFRNKTLETKSGRGKSANVACFHYDECLKQVSAYKLGAKESADVLIKTLLLGLGEKGKG